MKRAPILVLLAAIIAALGLVTLVAPVHRASAQAAAATPPGVCGTVSSFTAATATAAGSITISTANQNQTFSIAPGTVLGNSAGISATSNVCLQFTLNSAGVITGGQFTANNPVQIVVCGAVTAYTAATASAAGALTIGGIAFATAPGAGFTGGTPTAGQTQSISATLNGLGLITQGTVASGNCPNGPTLSGPYSSFTAPTATTAGSVTFGSATFAIAAGSNITVSGGVPLAATLAGGAQHNGATYFL
jgi:hypothetical protein